MTWKDLKDKLKDAQDEAPVAVLLNDGSLDYAVTAWQSDDPQHSGTIVIAGN